MHIYDNHHGNRSHRINIFTYVCVCATWSPAGFHTHVAE